MQCRTLLMAEDDSWIFLRKVEKNTGIWGNIIIQRLRCDLFRLHKIIFTHFHPNSVFWLYSWLSQCYIKTKKDFNIGNSKKSLGYAKSINVVWVNLLLWMIVKLIKISILIRNLSDGFLFYCHIFTFSHFQYLPFFYGTFFLQSETTWLKSSGCEWFWKWSYLKFK